VYLFHCRNSLKNCFPTQNFTEIGQSAAEWWPKKNDFHYGCRPPSRILKNSYRIIRLSLSSECAIVYQIWSKSDDFSLKCGGFTIFKMADIRYVEFLGAKMGFLKSPCSTSYWSSIEITALNRLVFWENHVVFKDFGDRQTDEQTDGQRRCVKSLRRLNKSFVALLTLTSSRYLEDRDDESIVDDHCRLCGNRR